MTQLRSTCWSLQEARSHRRETD